MAEDGKIYITISDKRGSNNGIGSTETTTTTSVSSKPKTKEDNQSTKLSGYAEHEFFHFVKGSAKTFVDYTISNYGNFTGNYLSQKNINIAMDNLGKVAGIGLSTLQGAKIGGPVGAVIGFAVGVGTTAINFGLAEKTAYFENRRTNRELSMIRDLSGLNTLTNESR